MKSIDPVARELGPDAVIAVPVWDLPIRLFHWALAALIGFSWWSAENGRIEWHIWSGIAVLNLLLFRLLWGFFGSSTARFSGFLRGPRKIVGYLKDPGGWHGIGHNPLGALSVIALLLATAIQVGLGLVTVDEDGINQGPLSPLVSLDTSELAGDLHETFFNVLLALVALHIAAIVYYLAVRRKGLVRPMITGRATFDRPVEGMRPAHWWVAMLCIILSTAVTRWVVAGAPPFGG